MSSFCRCDWIQRRVQSFGDRDSSTRWNGPARFDLNQLWQVMPRLVQSHDCLARLQSHVLVRQLDLSFLPSLVRLERLRFSMAQVSLDLTPWSPAQLEALAQCKSLTALLGGQRLKLHWTQARGLSPEDKKTINNGLVKLVRRRGEIGAAPLRHLDLGRNPTIESLGWSSLSQCTELDQLDAVWSSALTAEDWMRLSSFQRLRILCIRGLSGDQPLDLGRIFWAILSCRALFALCIGGEFQLRAEHAALLCSHPCSRDA